MSFNFEEIEPNSINNTAHPLRTKNIVQPDYRYQGEDNRFYDQYPESPGMQDQQSYEEEADDDYSYPINLKKRKSYQSEDSSENFDDTVYRRQLKRIEREKKSELLRDSAQSDQSSDIGEGQMTYENDLYYEKDNIDDGNPTLSDDYQYQDSYGLDQDGDHDPYPNDDNEHWNKNATNIQDLIQDRIVPDEANLELEKKQKPSHSNDENDAFSHSSNSSNFPHQSSSEDNAPIRDKVTSPYFNSDAPITDTVKNRSENSIPTEEIQDPRSSQRFSPKSGGENRPDNRQFRPTNDKFDHPTRPEVKDEIIAQKISTDNEVLIQPTPSSHSNKMKVDTLKNHNNIPDINQDNFKNENNYIESFNQNYGGTIIRSDDDTFPRNSYDDLCINDSDNTHINNNVYQNSNSHPVTLNNNQNNHYNNYTDNTADNKNYHNRNNCNGVGNIQNNYNDYGVNRNKQANEQNRPYFQPNNISPNPPYIAQNAPFTDQSFIQNQSPYQNMFQYAQPNIPHYQQQNNIPYPPVQPVLYYPLPIPYMNMPTQSQNRECGHTVDPETFKNLFYQNMREFTRKTDDQSTDLSDDQLINMKFGGTHRKRSNSRLQSSENDKFLQCLQQISDQISWFYFHLDIFIIDL